MCGHGLHQPKATALHPSSTPQRRSNTASAGQPKTPKGNEEKALIDGKQVHEAASHARNTRVCAAQPHSLAAKWINAATADGLSPSESNAFRHARDITFKDKTTIMQLRCGRWIANGLRHKWKLAPSPRCPHCTSQLGAYDDGLHSATSCEHPVLRGMVTFRHDKAVHMIVDAVLKAHHEQPFQVLVSAGRRYQERAETLTKTIPDWALPGCTLQPDLVIVLGWAGGAPPTQPTTDITFVIADVTVGYGHTSSRRVAIKQAKYASLASALRQRGWSVHAASPGTCSPERQPCASESA